jgi:hypothetical protein
VQTLILIGVFQDNLWFLIGIVCTVLCISFVTERSSSDLATPWATVSRGGCVIAPTWCRGRPDHVLALLLWRLRGSNKFDTELRRVYTEFHREGKWRFAQSAWPQFQNHGAKRQKESSL